MIDFSLSLDKGKYNNNKQKKGRLTTMAAMDSSMKKNCEETSLSASRFSMQVLSLVPPLLDSKSPATKLPKIKDPLSAPEPRL